MKKKWILVNKFIEYNNLIMYISTLSILLPLEVFSVYQHLCTSYASTRRHIGVIQSINNTNIYKRALVCDIIPYAKSNNIYISNLVQTTLVWNQWRFFDRYLFLVVDLIIVSILFFLYFSLVSPVFIYTGT